MPDLNLTPEATERRRQRLTWREHAKLIKAAWKNNVAGIIAVGIALQTAKDDLSHGDWEEMFERGNMPCSIRNAQYFMAIARNPELRKTKNSSFLPATVSGLYSLVKLARARQNEVDPITKLIADGTITPTIKAQEIRALMPPRRRAPRSPRDPAPKRHAYVNWLRSLTPNERLGEIQEFKVAVARLDIDITVNSVGGVIPSSFDLEVEEYEEVTAAEQSAEARKHEYEAEEDKED